MAYIPTIEQTAQAVDRIHTQMGVESRFEVDQLVSQPVLIHYYCAKTGLHRPYVLAVSPISNPYLPAIYQPCPDNRECKAQDDTTDNSSASPIHEIDNCDTTESQRPHKSAPRSGSIFFESTRSNFRFERVRCRKLSG